MKILNAICIIAALSFAGEGLNMLIPLPIPASIYGLVLMLICLCTKVIKLETVKPVGGYLVEVMTVFFIPITVQLIDSWSLIREMLVPVLLALTVSTAIVMAVSGKVTQKIMEKKGVHNHE